MKEERRARPRWRISLHLWFWSVSIPLALLLLFVFVRIPMDVYEGSPGDHATALSDLVPWLAMGAVAMFLVLGVLLFVLLMRVRNTASAILIALALTFWIVDSFFFREYPQLDGTVQSIDADLVRGLLEVAIFAGLVILILAARGRAHVPALVFLALLTATNAFWAFANLPRPEPDSKTTSRLLSPDDLFTVSSRGNLVFILLDTFQSDYLADALAAEPTLADDLDGFIYFPDTLGEAPSTYLSMPTIHSGRMYDPARTMSGHFDRSVRGSFLGALARAGYDAVLLNPILRLCPDDVLCAFRDSVLRGKLESSLGDALRLLDISFMRSAPEFLKNRMFNRGQFHLAARHSPSKLGGEARVVWDDVRMLDLLADRLTVVHDRPRALFYHLMATHPPYVLDEHCNPRLDTAVHMDRAGAVLQIRCVMRRLSALIGEMRDAGVYGNSMLVVMGDHGSSSGEAGEDLYSAYLRPGSDVPPDAARLVGSANPLLLIKPPGATGPLRSDPRQADLTDVAATICNALAACEWKSGYDLLGPAPPPDRHRRFISYVWEHRFWELGYVPEIDFYSVQGPMHDWSSWASDEGGVRRMRIGGLTFSEADDPASFGDGWGGVEYDQTGTTSKRWATARQAILYLDLDPRPEGQSSYQLNFEVYTPDIIANQAIGLEFNGRHIATRKAGQGLQTISYRIPLDLVRDGTDTVTLVFDTLLEQAESRPLATSVFSLSIEAIALPDPAR